MSEKTLEERVAMLEREVEALVTALENVGKILALQERNAEAMTEVTKIIASKAFGVDVDEINEHIEKERKLS